VGIGVGEGVVVSLRIHRQEKVREEQEKLGQEKKRQGKARQGVDASHSLAHGKRVGAVVWFVCRVLCVVRAGRLGLEWEEGRLRGGGGRCLCEGRGGRAVALVGWVGDVILKGARRRVVSCGWGKLDVVDVDTCRDYGRRGGNEAMS